MRTVGVLLVSMLTGVVGCNDGSSTTATSGTSIREVIPRPDVSTMQPQVANAIEDARRRVEDRPNSAAAWGQYGQMLDAHTLREEAIVAYRQARRLAPDDFRWSYLLGTTMEFFNESPQAILDEYEATAKLQPSYPPTYVHMGEVLARLSEPSRARDAYLRAIRLDPNLVFAYRGAGQMSLLLDEPEKAVEYLRKADSLLPNDRSITVSLAQALRRLGRTEEAARLAERSRGLSEIIALPDPLRYETEQMAVTAAACRAKALSLAAAGESDAARRALAPLATVDPPNAYFHLTAGNAYARIGALDDALRHLRRSVAVDDDIAATHVELGAVLMSMREPQQAQDAFARAIEIEPANRRALSLLASLRAASGAEDEAIALFERAAAVGPLEARHEAMWATALLRRGDTSGAIEHFEKAVREQPGDLSARYNLGLAYERSRRPSDAVTQYRAILQQDPNHARARQRLARLGG